MRNLFNDGKFFTGCNYWASHAGTNMWHDWRPDVIDHDFELLAKENIKNLRIFPLWSDFQPIKMHYQGGGSEKEIRLGEDPLPNTEAGRAGVSELMADRFEEFCDLAEKHGIKLIVGLVTGWMSGRLHVPQLFETVNVITNPRAIRWQVKFVRYMVKRFKNHPAIAAWDLGNECNCMGPAMNSDEAYLWTNSITMAIKCEDNVRPVISGMHSSFPEYHFTPQVLGELLDVLCTHPYPIFTPYCDTDPITENKSVLHAVAETVMYRGMSGKPAFAEEVGTLGPLIASEENAASYINTILHLLWAHNCFGLMWWCGFEQKHLTHTPYDWNAVERELGLFHSDYSPKPVVKAIGDFTTYVNSFEHEKLPERIVDAVCIITQRKDSWLAAFGTFILAKQAGLDIEFCYVTDEIPDARAYIVPSVSDDQGIPDHSMKKILENVKNGAAYYQSIGPALVSPFTEYFGLKAHYHYRPVVADTVKIDGAELSFKRTYKVLYEEMGAKALLVDQDNIPVMSEYSYGDGTMYFLGYDLENIVGGTPGVVSGKYEQPYYKLYNLMEKLRNPLKKVKGNNPHIAYTEHILNDNKRIVVAVNCIPRESEGEFTLDGYKPGKILKNQGSVATSNGEKLTLNMKPNSAIIFEIDAE